jgi:hypothetical protein
VARSERFFPDRLDLFSGFVNWWIRQAAGRLYDFRSMNQTVAQTRSWGLKARRPLALVGLCMLLAACGKPPPPRTFTYFMEDRIAREGTILHCDQNSRETENDIECANARRASIAIALRLERERVETLERESQIKLEALRNEMAERERAVREATLAAARAERERYEAMWRNPSSQSASDFQPVGPPVPEDRLSLIERPSSLQDSSGE